MKGGLFINTAVKNMKTKVRKTKYNLVAIKEAADAVLVAQAIGMDIEDTRFEKSKISVLCPGHDDRNYGSCYLDERGCRCYVCNRNFDVFDMVRLHCDLDFRAAAGLVADLCGGRERFLIEDNGEIEDEFLVTQRIISRPDMDLIGLHSKPVYSCCEVVPDYYRPEREPDTQHVWYPGNLNKDEDDYIVIEKVIIKTPLIEILKNDPEFYTELIQNKAWEALENQLQIQKFVGSISRKAARDMLPIIRHIEEILIENGASLREPPEFFKRSQSA